MVVNTELQADDIPELCFVNRVFEICTVKILIGNKTHLIMGLYRPPSNIDSLTQFNLFSQLLANRLLSECCTVIADDFIIDIEESVYPAITDDFVNELRSAHFLPLITLPTLVTSRSATTMDHIWINYDITYKAGAVVTCVTDHCPVFVVFLSVLRVDYARVPLKFRDHSERTISAFLENAKNFCSSFISLNDTDVNDQCSQFCDGLFYLYSKCFPLKTKYISQKRFMNPWLTDCLLKSIDRNHRLHRLYRVNNYYRNLYNNYSNTLRRSIATAKAQYFGNKFECCRGNVRATWRSINHILKPNSHQGTYPTLNMNGKTISAALETAECFNQYFSNIGMKLDQSVPLVILILYHLLISS